MSWGSFEGEVKTRWLSQPPEDHRDMELLEDFAYVDQFGRRWEAPAGSVVNGASIPRALYSAIGPPYVGSYRMASVLHDVACDQRTATSAEVHHMFYNAMRCAGVGAYLAGLMYEAVSRFGPRWGPDGLRHAMAMTAGRMPGTGVNETERLVSAYKRAYGELGPQFELDELSRRVTEHMRNPPRAAAPAARAASKAASKPGKTSAPRKASGGGKKTGGKTSAGRTAGGKTALKSARSAGKPAASRKPVRKASKSASAKRAGKAVRKAVKKSPGKAKVAKGARVKKRR